MMSRHGTKQLVVKYTIGFGLSLITTLAAYGLVTGGLYAGGTLYIILGGLALLQMVIQLYYFLHLAEETGPRLRLLSLGLMSLILVIVVVGSLWIMNHLNYNMLQMDAGEKTHYMTEQKDKGF